jgi:hypothetical protein
MSPTICGLRFWLFSREEARVTFMCRVTVAKPRGWLEPQIELAQSYGLGQASVRSALRVIREREDEIRESWKAHFRR